MHIDDTGAFAPIDAPLPRQVKLAAAWAAFMFLYAYVDILGFYLPGVIDDILAGIVWEFRITQGWAVGALALMAVPILMIVLSTILPRRANRIANLVVASLYVLVSVGNVVGEAWTFYYGLAAGLEVTVLALILRLVWSWPGRAEEGPARSSGGLPRAR
mgnify:CR=1 FL=1